MAELIIFYKGDPILRETIEGDVTVGSGGDADIPLIDSVVPSHAKISVSNGLVVVMEDEGPVFVGGDRIRGAMDLKYGDRFDIGAYRFELAESSLQAKKSLRGDETLAVTSPGGGRAGEGKIPPIQFISPVEKKFRRARFIIGRGRGCDLVIDNPYVSSRHAEIFIHNGRYFIRDLHSRNGTFINNHKITENELPESGDVRLGKCILSYKVDRPEGTEVGAGVIEIPGVRPDSPARKIICVSSALKSVMEKLSKIAPTDDSVLLLGETGVGKDLMAGYLHHHNQKRKKGPFVIVNCTTIPPMIADSQLFGHVKGAFTGAVSDHKGFFQQADSGTLFLDEIGELSTESQARLLRVIEDGIVHSIGSAHDVLVDIRMVLATNRDINEARKDGKFREDLYQRFDWVINVPPLKERVEDIPPLVQYFLEQHAPVQLTVNPDVMIFLKSRAWRGNVRGLNRAVRRAVTNAVSRKAAGLIKEDFELAGETEAVEDLAVSVERKAKRGFLMDSIRLNKGNISRVSKELGVSRLTIRRWLESDGVDISSFRK